MKQDPEVLKKLKKGDKIKIYTTDLLFAGWFIFSHFSVRDGKETIECHDDQGMPLFGTLACCVVMLAECSHEWKRLDLFRTTEFHCAHCNAMRPFDIEKDEAA